LSIRFQADYDLRVAIVEGVRRAEPTIDFRTAHDAGFFGLGDPEVLRRCAQDGRVIVSHDCRTMPAHFRDHLAMGATSPGLIVIPQSCPIGIAVENLLLVWSVFDSCELANRTYHVPALEFHRFVR